MRLLGLEMKRVLTTRRTWILLLLTLLLSVVMAYIPVTFQRVAYTDTNGRDVELTGRDAIVYLQKLRTDIEGEVTPEKLGEALEVYQECLAKYDAADTYELPEDADTKSLIPFWDYTHGIREAFADSKTGIAPALAEINSGKMRDYYEKVTSRTAALLKMEQSENPSAQEWAIGMYSKVEKPFHYYSGISADAMDYQVLLSYLILIFCVIITAPIFTSDYQTGADDILRCTKYGRRKLAICKTISALLICGITYLLCLAVWIGITNTMFGWKSTKTSLQFMFSVSSLPNLNLGETQWICFAAAFVMLLAMISFVLYVSTKMRNTVSSLAVALVFVFLPLLITSILPNVFGTWMQCMLPGGGIGMGNSFLYALLDFKFLHLGSWSVWTPYAFVFFAVIQIPLFLCMTVRSHCKMRS